MKTHLVIATIVATTLYGVSRIALHLARRAVLRGIDDIETVFKRPTSDHEPIPKRLTYL